MTGCTVPPAGWVCTRAAGHDGPCAALPARTPPCVGHANCADERIEQHALALTVERFQRLNVLLEEHGQVNLWQSPIGVTLGIGSNAFTAGSLARAIDMALENT